MGGKQWDLFFTAFAREMWEHGRLGHGVAILACEKLAVLSPAGSSGDCNRAPAKAKLSVQYIATHSCAMDM